MKKRQKVKLNLYVRVLMIVMAMVILVSIGTMIVVVLSDKGFSRKVSSQVTEEELQAASEISTDEEGQSQTVEIQGEIVAEGNGKRLWDQVRKEDDPEDDEEEDADETEELPTEDYVLPYSSTSEVKDSDLAGLSAVELRIARNEIMARHGRRFGSGDLKEYFESKSWYHPTVDGDEFDAHSDEYLSDLEEKNIQKILSYE